MLPTPQVRVLRMPSPTAASQPDPLEMQQPADTPTIFPDSLVELARQSYGSRLIQQIRIPAIQVIAPVTPVGWSNADSASEDVEWDSPHAQVGWVISSGLPGETRGNVILYGHNNIDSSIFRNLADLKAGDRIQLHTAEKEFEYEVAEVHILPVLKGGQDTTYASFLRPGLAPRLLLISCWPPTNNTHRVIVVAYPGKTSPNP